MFFGKIKEPKSGFHGRKLSGKAIGRRAELLNERRFIDLNESYLVAISPGHVR
jgi:hypothetical protein